MTMTHAFLHTDAAMPRHLVGRMTISASNDNVRLGSTFLKSAGEAAPAPATSDVDVNQEPIPASNNNPKTTPAVTTLSSVPHLLNVIDEAPPDSLVVIKFYGRTCPLCKRVALKYKKMPRFYSKIAHQIQFYQMANTPAAHKRAFDQLGIDAFPRLRIYRNGQCIGSFGVDNATEFEGKVHGTLQQFLGMAATDWQSFLTAFREPIETATDLLNGLRETMEETTEESESTTAATIEQTQVESQSKTSDNSQPQPPLGVTAPQQSLGQELPYQPPPLPPQ